MPIILWWKNKIRSSSKYANNNSAYEVIRRDLFQPIAVSVLMLFSSELAADGARPNEIYLFNIPQQRADLALTTLAEQANLTLIFPYEKVSEITANSLTGEYSIEEAVQRLLQNTGLKLVVNDKDQFTIIQNNGELDPMHQKNKLSTAIIAILASMFGTHSSHAQESAATDQVAEEITVVGLRHSLLGAMNIKKNASGIVDAIVAEDIGKLPDNNIAESLQRIPGVQITRNHGEGSGVAIRGLTQVKTLLNGREIYSDTGRDLSLENVPTELLAGIDTYKNPSATLVEGGLGGVIDLKTRRPFDFDGFAASATTRVNYYDLAEKSKPEISGLITDRWDTSFGEFGALLSVAEVKSAGRFDQIGTEPFNNRYNLVDFNHNGVFPGTTPPAAGSDAGDLVISPNGGGNSVELTVRDRKAANFVGQWQPNSDTLWTLELTHNDYDYNQGAYVVFANRGSLLAAPGATFEYADTNVVQSGTYKDVTFTSNSNYFDREASTDQAAISGKWTPTEHLTVNTDIAYTTSKRTDASGGIRIGNSANPTGTTLSFDVRGDLPVYHLTGFDFNNVSAYNFIDSSHAIEKADGSGTAARIDANYTFDDSFVTSVDIGYRYASRDIEREQGSRSHFTGNQLISLLPEAAGTIPYTHFYRDQADQLIPLGIKGAPLNLIRDLSRVCAAFGDTVCNPVFNPLNNYSASEDTNAVDGQLNYGFDLAVFPVTGNVGIRYVTTDLNITGFRTSNGGVAAPIDQSTNYSDVLPSFNARVGLKDDLFLRLAAGKQITRPSFSQLAPNLQIGFANANATLTGNAGNPDLRPLRSTSYDASLEYYYSETGYAYLSAFQKDVKGFIQTVTTTENVAFPDYPNYSTADITRPQNGADGEIKGFEIGVQTFFDFLPAPFDGFGGQANYTRVNSSAPGPIVGTTVPLVGLSKNSYNLVAYYEKGAYRARIAYTHRDNYVDTTSGPGSGALPIYVQPVAFLSASFGYKINQHFDVSVDADNLGNSEYNSYFGNTNRPRYHNVVDRRIGLVLKMTY